jgi:ankyrin repeat protein
MSEAYLDTLNAKQLAKEYKTLAKLIKNKDDAVKISALEKLLEDSRYMIEGGCIIPLLEIIAPKKKTLDFSQVALENFLKFLNLSANSELQAENEEEATTPSGHRSDNPALDILKTVYSLSNAIDPSLSKNLHALQIISDLIVYKDEIKKYKPPKVKKGEPIPPPPKVYDSELSINLRNGGLQSLYIIVQALTHSLTLTASTDADKATNRVNLDVNSDAENENGIVETSASAASVSASTLALALSQVPNIITNLCQKVTDIAAVLIPTIPEPAPVPVLENELEIETSPESEGEGEEESEEDIARKEAAYKTAIQECSWALASLAALLQVNSDACQILLSPSSSVALSALPSLFSISNEFSHSILSIFNALSLQCDATATTNGLKVMSNSLYLNVIFGTADKASQSLKKISSSGEGEEDDDENAEKIDINKEVILLNTAVKTLTHMAIQQQCSTNTNTDADCDTSNIVFTFENVPNLLKSLNHIVTSEAIWETGKVSSVRNSSASDIIDKICILFGQIGLIDSNLRSCVCNNCCVTSLLTVLANSSNISISDSDSGSLPLLKLRRAVELSILQLITYVDTSSTCDSDSANTRWQSCKQYKTDEEFFSKQILSNENNQNGAEDEDEEETEVHEPVSQSVAFMNQLSLLLENDVTDNDLSNRSVRLLASLVSCSSNPNIFVKDVISIHTSVTKSLSALCHTRSEHVVNERLNKSQPSQMTEDAPEPEAGVDADAEVEREITIAVPVLPPSHLVIPAEECLYLALSLVEVMLNVDSSHVEAFATEIILKNISDVIFATGPTGSNATPTSRDEMYVTLYNPLRNLNGSGSDSGANVLLRPLALDVLATVIEVDESSPKGGVSLGVCTTCADACISTLSTEVTYSVHNRGRNVIVCPSQGVLDVSVLNAGIRALHSFATCGSEGISATLTALADYRGAEGEGEGNGLSYGSIETFREFLGKVSNDEGGVFETVIPSNEDGESEVEEHQANVSIRDVWQASSEEQWVAPQAFSEVLNGNSNALSTVSNLAAKSNLWPIVTLLSPIIAVLGGTQSNSETSTRVVGAAAAYCKELIGLAEGEEQEQSALYDIMDAVFIGLGGLITLTSATSSYGIVTDTTANATACELLQFIVCRGAVMLPPPQPDVSGDDEEEGDSDDKVAVRTESDENTYLTAWKAILNIWTNDSHQKDNDSTALLTAIRGGLPQLACKLIHHGVDVNRTDGITGITALMFALTLGQGDVVQQLISAGADVNAVDSNGNMVLKYAFATIRQDDISVIIDAARNGNSSGRLPFLGGAPFIENLIESSADLLVGDKKNGNSAIHFTVGLGDLTLSIGGQLCNITSASYIDETIMTNTRICEIMTKLVNLPGNANVNACNCDGATALHVAAARGHIELMKMLVVKLGAYPNCVDSNGFYPVHHAASCCPLHAVETIEMALSMGEYNSTKITSYDNERQDLSSVDRTSYDVDKMLDNLFLQAIDPTCINEKRHLYNNLVAIETNDGYNILSLLMGGAVLQASWSSMMNKLATTGLKDNRMSTVVTLLTKWLESTETKENALKLINNINKNNMNIYHSLALLLQGFTPTVELTEAQKRSKRVKSFESLELHIYHIIDTNINSNNNNEVLTAKCTQTVPDMAGLNECTEWTALHGAIAGDNINYINKIISQILPSIENENDSSAGLSSLMSIITAKDSNISIETINIIISNIGSNISNMIPNPIASAMKNNNVSALYNLASNPRIDINSCNHNGNTYFVEAIQSDDEAIIDAFGVAADRLDLNAGNENAIDIALNQRNVNLLSKLLLWRKNDVWERVIMSKSSDGRSKLVELEEENIEITEILGFTIPSVEPLPVEVVKSEGEIIDHNEGISESKDDDASVNGSDEKNVIITTSASASEVEVAVAPITTQLTEKEKKEYENKLIVSNNIIKLLLDSGIVSVVDVECHAHSCFNENVMYKDFVINANEAKAKAKADVDTAAAATIAVFEEAALEETS